MTMMPRQDDGEERRRLEKEFTQNFGIVWWDWTVKPEYIDWLQGMFKQYASYINQEADRTGRFPVTHMKNFLALLREQEQRSLAADVARDIERYSEKPNA